VESQHGSMGMSTHGPMDMGPPVEECCAEKMVGSVSYTLAEAPFRGAIPHQCLNDCVYTVTGTSSPKFCFQRGDLPTECLDSPEPPLATTDGTTEQGCVPGHSTDCLAIWAKDATSARGLAGAEVELHWTTGLDNRMLSGVTNAEGFVVFTLSLEYMGETANITLFKEGYISMEKTITIGNEQINFFVSPELAEGQHRLVLSWETSTDLDVYALQKDKMTGQIVCKTWWSGPSGCAGVNLDIDVAGYGPETITWWDADNDAYVYELYVNDYDRCGVAGTGAAITLYGYGETSVKLSVVDGDIDCGSGSGSGSASGDLWWMLGTFEPSNGTSSFSTNDFLQSYDPASSWFRNSQVGEKQKSE